MRHILTRDALHEGSDAPLAYVLSSVFNLCQPLFAYTAIERLLGRILRPPNVREKKHKELHEGFVHTSAGRFNKAVNHIVKGMVDNGDSEHEVRISEKEPKYTTVMKVRNKGLSILLMAVNVNGKVTE